MYKVAFRTIDPTPNERVRELCHNEVMDDAAPYGGASVEDIRGHFCRLIRERGKKPNGAIPSESSCLVDAEVLVLFVKEMWLKLTQPNNLFECLYIRHNNNAYGLS